MGPPTSFSDLAWHSDTPSCLAGPRPKVAVSDPLVEWLRSETLRKDKMPGFPIGEKLVEDRQLKTYLELAVWHRLEQNAARRGGEPSFLKWFGDADHMHAVLVNTNLPDRMDPEDDLLLLLVPSNESQLRSQHVGELKARAVFPARELVLGEKMSFHLSNALKSLLPGSLLESVASADNEECILIRDGSPDAPVAIPEIPADDVSFDTHAKVHLMFDALHLRKGNRLPKGYKNVTDAQLRQAVRWSLRDLRRNRHRAIPCYHRDLHADNDTGKVALLAPLWLGEAPSTDAAHLALVLTPRMDLHTGERYYTCHSALPLHMAWRNALILNPSLCSWLNPAAEPFCMSSLVDSQNVSNASRRE